MQVLLDSRADRGSATRAVIQESLGKHLDITSVGHYKDFEMELSNSLRLCNHLQN